MAKSQPGARTVQTDQDLPSRLKSRLSESSTYDSSRLKTSALQTRAWRGSASASLCRCRTTLRTVVFRTAPSLLRSSPEVRTAGRPVAAPIDDLNEGQYTDLGRERLSKAHCRGKTATERPAAFIEALLPAAVDVCWTDFAETLDKHRTAVHLGCIVFFSGTEAARQIVHNHTPVSFPATFAPIRRTTEVSVGDTCGCT